MQDTYNEQSKILIDEFIARHPHGVIIIRWATATGKTWLSLEMAKHFPVEIIGADSRQLFRGMDIGTDKISQEIRKKVPHHQIDIISPDEHYTAGQWQTDTENIIRDIQTRGKIPMIVGWTGLYVDTIYKNFSMPELPPNPALREELYAKEEAKPWCLRNELFRIDPEEANKHHMNSLRYIIRALEIYYSSGKTKTESFTANPPQWPLLMIGLRRWKDETNKRINKRIHEMFDEWLIEEVQWLLNQWYDPNLQSMQGIGYKEVVEYIHRKINKDKCEELIKRNTHYLAKKQRTWFRRYIADAQMNTNPNIIFHTFMLD